LSWQSLASILDLLHVLYQVSPIVIDVEQAHRMSHHDTEITIELQAKAAAKRILKNVSNPGARYLEEEDLLRFFKKSKVAFVFPQFGGHNLEELLDISKIKKYALKNWMG